MIRVAAFLLACGAASAGTLRVGSAAPFASLSAALAAADSGDILLVSPGLYREKGLRVEKPLTLRGLGRPVLDAEGGITILDILADGVEVEGFDFRNVGVNHLKEHGAIWINGASGAVISGNRFDKAFFGVVGYQARRATVRNNEFEGLRGGEFTNGNGVHFWKSESVSVADNVIRGHRDGIYLEFTGGSTVTGNTCEGNVRYGLHFMYANGNSYRGNAFRRNGAGVAVMYSRQVHMHDNLFEDNWGAASYGLLLKAIRDSRIEGNRFLRNTAAVFQEGSSDLVFRDNLFRSNGWALRVVADCDRNAYAENRFEGNTFDLAYNASPGNSNVFRRNAWDRYAGYDLDRDGLGDVPHRPVELFSALVQNHPQALVLLRGHFPALLNVLERLFPTLTPASLEDTEPRMAPGNRKESG